MFLIYIIMRKLSEEEKKRRRYITIKKYRSSEKGRLATRKAALKYYHKNKVLKNIYVKSKTI
jgi:hypothetical protein